MSPTPQSAVAVDRMLVHTPTLLQSAQSMVVSSVPDGLSGHVLVLGVPRSQEGLLALLAPLRSRRLTRLRPIVIIDAQAPGRGGCWDTLATFKSTYFIQVCSGGVRA